MKIWALGDLHLPSRRGKSMTVFGPRWENYQERMAARWRERVDASDVVVVPGDISWAMHLEEAAEDLAWIAALPSRCTVLMRGNHDYWWSTKRKLENAAPPPLVFLHKDAVQVPPFVFAGTRGWDFPSPDCSDEENVHRERLIQRETDRLRRSFTLAQAMKHERLIALMHFPPLYPDQEATPFTEVIDEFSPEVLVYGHLHGEGIDVAFQGERNGTRYVLASADAVDFTPVLIAER